MNILSRTSNGIPTRNQPLIQGVYFIFRHCIEPKSKEEDQKRREYILNILLFGSLVALVIFDFIILFNTITLHDQYPGVSFFAFSGLVLLFALLLFLSRKGYHLISSYSIIILFFIGTLYTMVRWGVDLPIVLISFAFLIVVSSILVSTKFGFIATGIVIISIYCVGYLQVTKTLSPTTEWKITEFRLVSDGIGYATLLYLIGVVSWLSNRETERSLHRARSSEAALREERNSLEVKVEQRTAELKQAQLERIGHLYRFVELGRLASGMFHDLINPLTGIALQIRELKDTPSGDATQVKNSVDRAVVAADRMQGFIQAIRRQMSQQETREQFAVNEQIKYAMHLFHYKAKFVDVSLILKASQEIQLVGNPLKFHQIIANLISNAIDAYDGTNVVALEREKSVVIKIQAEDDRIKITVQDWGQGILPEHLKKIYDPFFTTKDLNKGTGIGLSTTKSMVEFDFNGVLEVSSRHGEGTTFTIQLPLQE